MYVYKGVINTMDIPKGIIFEIGGGSTKIVRYNRKNLLNYETLPFGAVTLTELFASDGLAPEEQAAKIEEFFTEQLKRIEWLKDIDPETQLIGVGGSFRSLCKISKMMKKSPLTTVHNYRIDGDEFNNIYNMLKVLDLDKKKRIKGVSSSRADILYLYASTPDGEHYIWPTDKFAGIGFAHNAYFDAYGFLLHNDGGAVATAEKMSGYEYSRVKREVITPEVPPVPDIPEPSAFGLLAGVGALALVAARRRRSRS